MDDNKNEWFPYTDDEYKDYKKGLIGGFIIGSVFTTVVGSIIGYAYYTRFLKK